MRIMQCFNWKLRDIIPVLERIKVQGFQAIQINPLQGLKEDGLKEWWMSYQPIGFEIGNYFGTKEDLIALCNACEEKDMIVIADVVTNHVGSSLEDNLIPHPRVDENLRNNPSYWKPRQNVSDWHNRQDVIHNCMGLPSLNVYHPDIEDKIVTFLNELIDCGVMGFRFDAAKSIGLPSEGYRFWPNLIYRLKKYGLFLYGEVIFEENRKVLDEYSEYMNILGNYDCSNPSKMVKFVESHDTYLSDGLLGYTRYLSSESILKAYCTLVDEYEHTLFYVRPWDDTWEREEIKKIHFKKRSKEYCKK